MYLIERQGPTWQITSTEDKEFLVICFHERVAYTLGKFFDPDGCPPTFQVDCRGQIKEAVASPGEKTDLPPGTTGF